MRNQKQRATTLTALLLLSWVGLHLFGSFHFGTSQPSSAVNAFYFAEQLLAGVCAVMIIFLFWPPGTKTMLRISGILFVGFNVYAVAHYHLRHLAPAIRLFYMGNGLAIGMSIPSAILLWQEGTKNRKQNGRREIAVPERTTQSGEPSRSL